MSEKKNSMDAFEPVKEEISDPKNYLVVRRVTPEKPNGEGMIIGLNDKAEVDERVYVHFIKDVFISTLPDGRTTVMTALLLNNHIINVSHTAVSREAYDEEKAVKYCKGKIEEKIKEFFEFLMACAVCTPDSIEKEVAYLNGISGDPADIMS